MNFEAVAARYVDVRLKRKKEVLDAYHAAVHPPPGWIGPSRSGVLSKKKTGKYPCDGVSCRRVS